MLQQLVDWPAQTQPTRRTLLASKLPLNAPLAPQSAQQKRDREREKERGGKRKVFGKWGRAYKFNLAANPRWVFFRLSGPIRVQKYEIRKEGSLLYNAKESAKVTTKSYRQCWKCLAKI